MATLTPPAIIQASQQHRSFVPLVAFKDIKSLSIVIVGAGTVGLVAQQTTSGKEMVHWKCRAFGGNSSGRMSSFLKNISSSVHQQAFCPLCKDRQSDEAEMHHTLIRRYQSSSIRIDTVTSSSQKLHQIAYQEYPSPVPSPPSAD
jgi:hypothetical protein